MKLFIQEKVFSLTNKFSVKDEAGTDRYFVEGELFSFGRKLHIKDAAGAELALVSQKVLTLLPRFTISVRGIQVAEITKKLTFFNPKYTIDGLDWEINGDFLGHDYTITKGADTIVTIHKKWMSWGDSFEVDLAAGTDEITALSVVLAIDCVLDDGEQQSTRH